MKTPDIENKIKIVFNYDEILIKEDELNNAIINLKNTLVKEVVLNDYNSKRRRMIDINSLLWIDEHSVRIKNKFLSLINVFGYYPEFDLITGYFDCTAYIINKLINIDPIFKSLLPYIKDKSTITISRLDKINGNKKYVFTFTEGKLY